MANPRKRSRRRERRRKVARKVAGRVLKSEVAQQVVSKGAGAVASIYGTPAAGLVVSRGLETAMERGASALGPKKGKGKKRAQKAAKKSAKKTRKAKAAGVSAVIGAPPISHGPGTTFGPKPGHVVDPITEDLALTEEGELVEFPSAPAEEERPFWQNPILLAAAAGAGFLLLRKKK